jgi:hypothetical protein
MPRKNNVTVGELSALLTKHNGDRDKVAEESGMTKAHLGKRITDTPVLRAAWSSVDPIDPNSIHAEERRPPRQHDPLADKRSIETWQKNGRDVFMTEVSDMLHDKDNIKKLDVFKQFDGNVGLHMARALEMTQNVNIRQNVALFEVAEELKQQILSGDLDEESYILKTRLFISCCDQQGKFYDRLLRGLEGMLKMSERETSQEKKKVGFRPLQELEKIESTDG